MIEIPDATARYLHSLFDLLGVLKAADPRLADALDQGAARVTFDAQERVILVSVIDQGGHAHPLTAIHADPFDRDLFGAAGAPEPVAGLYATRYQEH